MDSIGVIANTKSHLTEQTQEDAQAYWYYKYCEEEWALFDTFSALSERMQAYIQAQEDIFVNPQTYTDTETFENHCAEIIKRCQTALMQFRETITPNHADILLTLQVRDDLDCDEKAEIFQAVNAETASQEYIAHIAEFI